MILLDKVPVVVLCPDSVGELEFLCVVTEAIIPLNEVPVPNSVVLLLKGRLPSILAVLKLADMVKIALPALVEMIISDVGSIDVFTRVEVEFRKALACPVEVGTEAKVE